MGYHYDPDDIQMDNYDHQEEEKKQEEHESENRITITTQNIHVCCNEGYDSYILYYYLLKSYRKDGGIWIKEETEEDGNEELNNYNNSNSYILFDEIISNACIRKYYKKIEKSNDSYDYYSFRNNESIDRFHRSSNHSSRIEYLSFSNSFNNNSQLNFHNNDSDEAVEDEYYWISPSIENLFTSSPSSISTTIKLNLKIKEKEDEETIEDIIIKLKEEYDILLYIFQMLPMHLLKCNKIKKVKDYCFHSSNFIHGRLLFSMMIQLQSSSSSGVGVMECIKLIKNEWFLYLLIYNNEKEGQNNMKNRKNNADYSNDSKDPYITIISIFTKIRQFLLTEFPIKNNSNNNVNQVIMDNESTSKKDYYYEVGKALQTLASTLEKVT